MSPAIAAAWFAETHAFIAASWWGMALQTLGTCQHFPMFCKQGLAAVSLPAPWSTQERCLPSTGAPDYDPMVFLPVLERGHMSCKSRNINGTPGGTRTHNPRIRKPKSAAQWAVFTAFRPILRQQTHSTATDDSKKGVRKGCKVGRLAISFSWVPRKSSGVANRSTLRRPWAFCWQRGRPDHRSGARGGR